MCPYQISKNIFRVQIHTNGVFIQVTHQTVRMLIIMYIGRNRKASNRQGRTFIDIPGNKIFLINYMITVMATSGCGKYVTGQRIANV